VGNSASRANNHIEILYKLSSLDIDMSYKVMCPLSYGDMNYQQEVIAVGNSIFGDKFIPLTKIVESNSYYSLLSTVDIALFNHNRQEGMGTMITLLGMGKKVYLQNSTAQWLLFKSLGVSVFAINELLGLFSDIDTKQDNIDRIKNYFSLENLKIQTSKIFEE
jgi:hypothetical protein